MVICREVVLAALFSPPLEVSEQATVQMPLLWGQSYDFLDLGTSLLFSALMFGLCCSLLARLWCSGPLLIFGSISAYSMRDNIQVFFQNLCVFHAERNMFISHNVCCNFLNLGYHLFHVVNKSCSMSFGVRAQFAWLRPARSESTSGFGLSDAVNINYAFHISR